MVGTLVVKGLSVGWKVFFKVGLLKNFANFTAKHLCWSLFLIKLQAFRFLNLFPFSLRKFSLAQPTCFLYVAQYTEAILLPEAILNAIKTALKIILWIQCKLHLELA